MSGLNNGSEGIAPWWGSHYVLSLEDLVKLVSMGEVVDHYAAMMSFGEAAYQTCQVHKNLDLADEPYAITVTRLTALRDGLIALELPLSSEFAAKAVEVVEKAKPVDGKSIIKGQALSTLASNLHQLLQIFGKELATRKFFTITQPEAALVEPPAPLWGAQFTAQFPCAAYDLDEAAKCLGLGRSTAAVFHIMRIVEAGLKALHQCLGISVVLEGPERNWGRICERIKNNIASRKPSSEKDSFQEMYALLDSVKDSWRNKTMHLEKKYTPEDADHIFTVVRGFMKKVASRMDEDGNPKA